MIICLILALYLLAGLITATIFVKSLPSELRPFKEVMADISAGKTDPMLIVEMSLSFRKTNFGFLVTILSWPIWAVAIIHDAIYSKKNKKED